MLWKVDQHFNLFREATIFKFQAFNQYRSQYFKFNEEVVPAVHHELLLLGVFTSYLEDLNIQCVFVRWAESFCD